MTVLNILLSEEIFMNISGPSSLSFDKITFIVVKKLHVGICSKGFISKEKGLC